MPKLNPVGVAAASIAFYVIGFVWYGVIFADAWMAANGVTEESAKAESPLWMAVGFVITVMQVIGLALALRWKGDAGPAAAARMAAMLWAFLALPLLLYAYIYLPAHNATLLLIDASHILVGWVVASVVLALFRVK